MNWSIPSKHLLLSLNPAGRECAYIHGWINKTWNTTLKDYEHKLGKPLKALPLTGGFGLVSGEWKLKGFQPKFLE